MVSADRPSPGVTSELSAVVLTAKARLPAADAFPTPKTNGAVPTSMALIAAIALPRVIPGMLWMITIGGETAPTMGKNHPTSPSASIKMSMRLATPTG